MIDLLGQLVQNVISEDEAYEIYEDTIQKYHKGLLQIAPAEVLNMDKYEWTAFGHGASLKTIADWRQFGWPKYCSQCGSAINYVNFGWTIRENKLKGLSCCS